MFQAFGLLAFSFFFVLLPLAMGTIVVLNCFGIYLTSGLELIPAFVGWAAFIVKVCQWVDDKEVK